MFISYRGHHDDKSFQMTKQLRHALSITKFEQVTMFDLFDFCSDRVET